MRREPRLATLFGAFLLLGPLACGQSDDAGAGDDGDLAFCVAENNRYREMVVPNDPFTRSAALEDFAAEGARSDAGTRQPHGHFKATMGGGIAFAENMIPWWKLSRFGSVQAVMTEGLRLMFAEGPGPGPAHGHYENMVGKYDEIGCGVFIEGDEVTVTMNFR